MKTEKPKDATTNIPQDDNDRTVDSFSKQLPEMAWRLANFSTVVFMTSGLISLIQNPIQSLLLSKVCNGQYMPTPSLNRAGIYAASRFLYTGLTTSFTSSSVRSAYNIGAKKMSANTEAHEIEAPLHETKNPRKGLHVAERIGLLAGISAFDVCFSQIPSALSDLKKLNTIDNQFKWSSAHNVYKLTTTCAGSRFVAAMINITALSLLEEEIHHAMPFSSEQANHLLSGAISGSIAGIATFPLKYYRDVALSKVTLRDGQLQTINHLDLIGDMIAKVKSNGIQKTVVQVAKTTAEQLPLRTLSTALTYAIICTTASALGDDPLRFFSSHHKNNPPQDNAESSAPNQPKKG